MMILKLIIMIIMIMIIINIIVLYYTNDNTPNLPTNIIPAKIA